MPAWLDDIWYGQNRPAALLRGLAAVYGAVSQRRALARRKQSVRLPVPVIVIGNIGVGGTGKTPLVIWLVERLKAHGLRPGVVSRGYGGRARQYPLRVTGLTDPLQSGDEPALMARRLSVPVAVAPDRVAAAQLLLERGEIDVIVSDDGLQHYRLARDLEICVVDGLRALGNGRLLPAGPLRELPERLAGVDLVVVNGGGWRPGRSVSAPVVDMWIESGDAVSLTGSPQRPLSEFRGMRVHAVAGIGNPARFFTTLRSQGIEVIAHPFRDHHRFSARDLQFGDDAPVLMTEKDAVKCSGFARAGWWFVPARAFLDRSEAAVVQQFLDDPRFRPPREDHGQTPARHPRVPGHQGAVDLASGEE